VPQREAVRAQRVLQVGPQHAGLNARGARGLVQLHDPRQMIEIDRHGRAIRRHGHTPDHGGAAAVWNRRMAGRVAPGKRRLEFVLGARVRHRVGRLAEITMNGAQ
jgi:hypothetical protein